MYFKLVLNLQIFKDATRRKFKAGEVLYCFDKDIFQLNFIIDGLVKLELQNGVNFNLGSGKFFDLRLFSLMGIFLGFESNTIKSVVAVTDGVRMTWEIPAILKHASGAYGPALPNYCTLSILCGLNAFIDSPVIT